MQTEDTILGIRSGKSDTTLDPAKGKGNHPARGRPPAADAGDAPQARIVRCSATDPEPPDGARGNRLTTGVSQQDPYNGKGNDSGKSAANRRNPALLRSRQQLANEIIAATNCFVKGEPPTERAVSLLLASVIQQLVLHEDYRPETDTDEEHRASLLAASICKHFVE